MTEQALRKSVQRAVSKLGARLFRVNTGLAWSGTVVSRSGGYVTLRDARPIRMGLVNGGSDLIGWSATGQFVAIELKTGRLAPTREQAVFLAAVRRAGGLAGVARSVEDAIRVVSGPRSQDQDSALDR